MPKKHLYNRLDRLFSDIQQDDTPVPDAFNNTTPWVDKEDASTPTETEVYQGDAEAPSTDTSTASDELASTPWTNAALQSLNTNRQTMQIPREQTPAAFAVPFHYGMSGKGVLEILDVSGRRLSWTEEERLLIQEVTSQMALALENAQLYEAAQQELAERKRAESEILRRSDDLATLNQIGQELSRLSRQRDILDIIQATINKMADGRNIVIALLDTAHKAIYYPIFLRGGQMQTNPDLETTGAIIQHLLQNRSPLLIKGRVRETFSERGLQLSGRLPSSLLGIPMIAGDRPVGAILLENYESDAAFTDSQLELLSTVASQATIALENAKLFGEIRTALAAIENRERYQSSVARAVAALTEYGTQKLSDVLEILGRGAKTGRVQYYCHIENEPASYWTPVAAWTNPEQSNQFIQPSPKKLPGGQYSYWAQALQDKGWISGSSDDLPISERVLLKSQGIRSTLMISVAGKSKTPGFIAFEQVENNRRWQNDEINILQVAADALANTLLRENLLDQLQASLNETEKLLAETAALYQISTGISQASSLKDLLNLLIKKAAPTGADQAAVIKIVYSQDDEPLELEFIRFAGEDTVSDRLPFSDLPMVHAIGDSPLLLTDIDKSMIDRISLKTLLRYEIKSACLIPLKSAGRSIGFMLLAATKPVEFDPTDIHTFEIAATGIAAAVERQQLLEEARRRAMELQAAAEVARDTTSTLSLDILLKRIVNQVITRFKFYHASIFLKEETGHFIVIRESTGEAGQALKEQGFKLSTESKSIIGQVIRTGQAVTVNDVTRSSIYFPTPLLPDTRSEMGLPLRLGERILGVLDIQSEEFNAFTSDDTSVMQILADQIAVAIDNARSYELVQKAIEDMREVDRMKSQFLANMSHELRTPLNSIIGFSRVILKGIDGPINEIQEQDLTAIYNSGQHLLNLINDVLDLSKIEAGKMELSFTELDLQDLIRSVMSTATGLVKDKPIHLSYSIQPDLPTVYADSTRIRQVLLNFISNAAKFTGEGSIVIEAGRSTDPNGQPEVMVTVSDTGPGIAADDRSKLFLPFSQVDDSPTRKTGGTGLGLSICRSLVEMHHGRIGLLSSEIGKGSTFYFTLPLPPTTHTTDIPPATAASKTVLCIDDDPQLISLYQRYLTPNGYQVVPATDLKQVVECARTLKPVAITLDVMMPEKNGWQILQELKSDPETCHIPIVMCTILEEAERGLSLGASEYLVKPFLQEDLIDSINRLTRPAESCSILIIDDNPDDLRLIQKIIQEKSQHQVVLAEGGSLGWEYLTSNSPDIVILDLFMPDPNGFKLLYKMQSSSRLSDIPVIVLTGADLSIQQKEELRLLSRELLTKDADQEKNLLNALHTALNQNRAGS
jgi:signal transduction histidine kinase/DNA-binding response OmpR family regulator